MKTEQKNEDQIELQEEYIFDYSKGKPNRFADKLNSEHLLVSIDNDLLLLFNNAEKVNNALRSYLTLIEAKQAQKQS